MPCGAPPWQKVGKMLLIPTNTNTNHVIMSNTEAIEKTHPTNTSREIIISNLSHIFPIYNETLIDMETAF